MADTRTTSNGKKVSFRRSLPTKITGIYGFSIAAIVTLLTLIASVSSKNTIEDIYVRYTQNVAEAAAVAVSENLIVDEIANADIQGTGDGTTMEQQFIQMLKEDPDANRETVYNSLDPALGAVELTGIDGSYAYMVSADGLMIYHPTQEKIGASVENAAVKGLVTRLQSGESPSSIGSGSIIYEFKGALKYAGYAFTHGGSMVIVTGDYNKIMTGVSSLTRRMILVAVIVFLISFVVFYFLMRFFLRPVNDIVDIIDGTARFDFRHHPKSDGICARKDELGLIGNSVRGMRRDLRDIVRSIGDAASVVGGDVVELNETTEAVNAMCTDNSATTEELAASMEEAAASVESIGHGIGDIQNATHQIEMMANDGTTMSDEVKERAKDLARSTDEASDSTRRIYDSVKEKSDEAIESSKAVDKINELTGTIMAISSQTSLLALNASIEAARAGEAGRGFAVVATEIGNLANQTSTAVADINGIVGEVNRAVSQMAGCLKEMTDFLEETVLKDYDSFKEVSTQYESDADMFRDSMVSIKLAVDDLTQTIAHIVESVSSINTTVGESATGVSDIAGKTTDIVCGMSDTQVKVDECRQCVDELNGILAKFVM